MSRFATSYLAGSELGGRQTAQAFQTAMAQAHLLLSQEADARAQEAHDQRMQDAAREVSERQAGQDYLTRHAESMGMFNRAMPDGTVGPPSVDEGAADQFRGMDPILQRERVRSQELMLERERERTSREKLTRISSETRERLAGRKIAQIEQYRPVIGDKFADAALAAELGTPTQMITPTRDPKAINPQEAAARSMAAAESAQQRAVEAARVAAALEARNVDPDTKTPLNPQKLAALNEAYRHASQRLAELSAERARAEGQAAGSRVPSGQPTPVGPLDPGYDRAHADLGMQMWRRDDGSIIASPPGRVPAGTRTAPPPGAAGNPYPGEARTMTDPKPGAAPTNAGRSSMAGTDQDAAASQIVQQILALPGADQLTDDQIADLVMQQLRGAPSPEGEMP